MDYSPPRTWQEVPAAVRAGLVQPFTKTADGLPVLRTLGDVAGWRAGPINETWGGPRPLTNLLIGAALGSLGGYGVGRLGEQFLPGRYFTPGAARKRMAILGGALGVVPAAWQAYDNVTQAGGDLSAVLDRWPAKAAGDGLLFDPNIPVDEFNGAVMADPTTPLRLRAATAGLVTAAGSVRGGPLVSPWDVARVAVGAGSGLVSGLIVGKALGLLAGLNQAGQEKLQDIGMWSGVLRNTVPQALGLR